MISPFVPICSHDPFARSRTIHRRPRNRRSPLSMFFNSSSLISPKTLTMRLLSTERTWSTSAKDCVRSPLPPGWRDGYRAPSPSVFVTGTTHTIGNFWSFITSGSVMTTHGRTPRCSCPRVGSRDTKTIVPRVRFIYSYSTHPLPGTHFTLTPA
jgi:hypothetical protein